MMNVAIQNSLQTTRSAGEASSSRARTSTNPEAALRAAAAERRIQRDFARGPSEVDSDYDEDMDMASASADDESDFSDSEYERARPRAKSKSKSPVKPRDTSQPEFASMETMRSSWAAKRAERRRVKSLNQAEERALRKKLGRKLTHVSGASQTSFLQLFYHSFCTG